MPVSIVVGGQFGSEGKGKSAHILARACDARAVVRVGGPNSGHTVIDPRGRARVFRQLPTACLLTNAISVLPAGAYLDVDLVCREIAEVQLAPDRLWIDPAAVLVTASEKEAEQAARLHSRIGSTLSGTGEAVSRRVLREERVGFAGDEKRLASYIKPVRLLLRELLSSGERVLIEGTQGFGLSLLHSGSYPYSTSRDTTAAGALAEVGLSPLDVDEVVLVLRAFPIRVAGNSGPLSREIDWSVVTKESGSDNPILEHTSVTRQVRRVGRFDAEIVRRAIIANRPTQIVLNHVDHVDAQAGKVGAITPRAGRFIETINDQIGQRIDLVGLSPSVLVEYES